MCDLNPIELAWRKVKDFVRSNNTTGDMSLSRLHELVQRGIASVSKDDWAVFCNHVKSIEDAYWEKDGLVENAVDEMIINLGDDSSDDNNSDTDTASDEDMETFESAFALLQ